MSERPIQPITVTLDRADALGVGLSLQALVRHGLAPSGPSTTEAYERVGIALAAAARTAPTLPTGPEAAASAMFALLAALPGVHMLSGIANERGASISFVCESDQVARALAQRMGLPIQPGKAGTGNDRWWLSAELSYRKDGGWRAVRVIGPHHDILPLPVDELQLAAAAQAAELAAVAVRERP